MIFLAKAYPARGMTVDLKRVAMPRGLRRQTVEKPNYRHCPAYFMTCVTSRATLLKQTEASRLSLKETRFF